MRRVTIVLITIWALLVLASVASAQGGYGLSRWTVDGGGWTFSAGGPYTLGATIGQPDAGIMLGGSYGLAGGFWCRSVPVYRLYLPVMMRDA